MIDVVSFVFQCIDFLIIAALFFYIAKYHVIPMVKKMIEEYHLFIQKIQSDQQAIVQESGDLIKKIKNQDDEFIAIANKFAIWQKKCQQQVALEKSKQHEIDKAMQKRFDARSHYLEKEFAVKDQLPVILDSVTKSLQLKYQTHGDSKKYIEELIFEMKELS